MKAFFMLVLALYTLEVGAHANVVESTPAAGSVVTTAPKEIELLFKTPVRLTRLTIEQKGQAKQQLKAPAEASRRVVAPAPKLSPGEYIVTWTAVGQDGHVVSGTVAFSVAGD
jgi:methionine-rich copper-binding protein CopC